VIVSQFTAAPRVLSLAEREVHVFRARLDGAEDFGPLLDADEAGRASRFRLPLHRTRFIAAHGLLRTLLGGYLGIAPQRVAFTHTDRGKPAVEGLKFNMSHSEDLALFAFALDMEVGIDVEFRKADFPAREMAREVFTEREGVLLTNGAADFFRIWTCKEALLKAAGRGLSAAPADIDVFFDPPSIRANGGPLAGSRWALFELDADPRYAGALVVSEEPSSIRCYESRTTES
jgi:4'-phosphopantetheinyl transferase